VSFAPELLAILACLVASAIFEGTETGIYSLSRVRVEAEAAHGSRRARLVRQLLRHEVWLLITLLVGNNVVQQLSTVLGMDVAAQIGLAPEWREVALAVVLTPIALVACEIFPKDLFLRRPHAAVGAVAPLVAATRIALTPLTLPLVLLETLSARLLGLAEGELVRVQGREAVIDLLRERHVEVEPHVEKMARNVLELRRLHVDRVMVPWRKVEVVRDDLAPAAGRQQVAQSPFSRLPVVDAGGAVRGYVHQLEVLGAPDERPLLEQLRPLIAIAPDTPLDRALVRLRATAQRAALVGTPKRPLGLVTLKDLVEEISGELARW
jgi:CBS domain containing-hemolysin-like protein